MQIEKLKTILPKIKIPDIIQDEEKREQLRESVYKEQYDDAIESELKDIQEKLRMLH